MNPQYSIESRFRELLRARETKGHRRSLELYPGHDFYSNDYLGLATSHAEVVSAGNAGSTGSRLISGNSSYIEGFERDVAQFHGFEHSLLFSSGYAANTGLLSCVSQADDLLVLDSLAHASLIDGARLGRAPFQFFAHNSLKDLKRMLVEFEASRRSESQRVFVVVESLYSMDGDFAPLQELTDLCRHHNASLIVDEAHSVGVYGQQGAGLVAQLNLQSEVFAAVYTYGKAMGRHGAIIAGSQTLRDYLINYCRPFIYTTAPSPQTVNILAQAYDDLKYAKGQRVRLMRNIDSFAQRVKSIPLGGGRWCESSSAIQALVLGEPEKAKKLAQCFHSAGFALKAILSPTVAIGSDRVRVCLHSHNTDEQFDAFAQVLKSSDLVQQKTSKATL